MLVLFYMNFLTVHSLYRIYTLSFCPFCIYFLFQYFVFNLSPFLELVFVVYVCITPHYFQILYKLISWTFFFLLLYFIYYVLLFQLDLQLDVQFSLILFNSLDSLIQCISFFILCILFVCYLYCFILLPQPCVTKSVYLITFTQIE